MSLVKNGIISSMDQRVTRKYDENYESIYGKRRVGGPFLDSESHGKLKKKNVGLKAIDNPESSLSKMLKEKTLVKHIQSGNASDAGVKREAMAIEHENNRNRIQRFRENQFKKLEQCKIELRKSGGFAQ